MLQILNLQITHSGYDFTCIVQGTLPHEGSKISYLCGVWNSFVFEVKIEITEAKVLKSSLPLPFQENIALGPLRRGQYCVVVNGNDAWTKWFGVD